MKRNIIFLISIICLWLPSAVHAVEGLPGSAWGNIYWEVPKNGDNNLILEGWVRQGVAWEKWQKDTTSFQLTTYLTARYKWDSEKLDWNNYFGSAVGIALDMESAQGTLLSWGIEYVWENNIRTGDHTQRINVFMIWYFWWDLMKKGTSQ